MNVLIVEDDAATGELIRKGFLGAGFSTELCSRGDDALLLSRSQDFDLAIIDVMVPGLDGLHVVDQLRREGREMPVLFLSAKRNLEDRIEGFRSGGDDYLTKPFAFTELLARSQAILRRASKQTDVRKLTFGDIEMDLSSRTVRRTKRTIELQQKEFALLEYLIRNAGQVLTKTQILEKIWSYSFDPQTNVVDVLVCRLRRKIARHPDEKLIRTIRGVGYVLQDN